MLVFARYREPVALVQSRDGYRLVDIKGVRLPGLYLHHQIDQLEQPLLEGIHASPRGLSRRPSKPLPAR